MGWAIGYDDKWDRDIGYGVPAMCDHPGCDQRIDRGLSFVCGNEPHGGDNGCGLFFCGRHQIGEHQQCVPCSAGLDPFTPTPDIEDWVRWKLTDESWQKWRDQNPEKVAAMEKSLVE